MSEAAIRAYAGARHFGTGTLDRWLRHAPADGAALLRVAEQLRLGENQLRDVLDAVEDIAIRSRCAIGDVLAQESVAGVLQRGRGRNEAIHALKQALRRLRYPELSATEARLNDLVKTLRLPRDVRISFPENLEGEEITVTLQVASAEQLRDRLRQLASLAECEQLDAIFRLLNGQVDRDSRKGNHG
jgi:HPt (histidine-containing phosphotransfer) domain-containing protein